jgi:hypothetical protein
MPSCVMRDDRDARASVGGPGRLAGPNAGAGPIPRRAGLIDEEAQVDWAHCGEVEVDGPRRTLAALARVPKWSRTIVLRFGFEMTPGAFLSHRQRAFEALSGVPRVILCGNLKSAVIARVGDAVVVVADLLALAGYCRCAPSPCVLCRGNENGAVEPAIRDVSETFWSGRPRAGLEKLNADEVAWSVEIRGARNNPIDPTLTNNPGPRERSPRSRTRLEYFKT